MRAVVQRVGWGRVTVEEKIVAECGPGLVVLAAAGRGDTGANAEKLADRIWGMRIFPDAEGKMNLKLADWETVETEVANLLLISNFTVYGDASQRRPSFGGAASFEEGQVLFQHLTEALRSLGVRVVTGMFGADMQVELMNDGPVTLVVEA